MQAAWQKNINLSISKTVNLAKTATREEIGEIYKLAWKLKCKGITVYRDGCRATGQVLDLTPAPVSIDPLEELDPVEVPKAFGKSSKYYELRTGSGPLHVHVDHNGEDPYRVFVNMPPIGTEISGMASILGVVVSKYLELGGDLKHLIKHFQSVTGDRPVGFGPNRIQSIPHALSIIFKDFIKTAKGAPVDVVAFEEKQSCPECFSSNFKKQEGCNLCHDCGFSSCS
jgi:ribonucleoside-diphosphate reductase alpha chain